jgi:hypothetical protein
VSNSHFLLFDRSRLTLETEESQHGYSRENKNKQSQETQESIGLNHVWFASQVFTGLLRSHC